jgi:glycosyltransferase involved in cell wall biosynthesis
LSPPHADRESKLIRILLIGPLPPPAGGDTRHFSTLVRDLGSHARFSLEVVNTSRGLLHSNFRLNLQTLARALSKVAMHGRRVDILSFHAGDRGMVLAGPLLVVLGKLLGLPTILRLFGGSFGDYYRRANRLTRAIIRRTILSADVVLLQTHRVIEQLQTEARGRLEWFSTYIDPPSPGGRRDAAGAPAEPQSCSRFVFLGHMWRSKGIETMLEAAHRLPPDCELDLYGAPDEYSPEMLAQRGAGRVRYRGLLTHAQVDAVLWDYDCLVLPTHHPSEGYPGVIAEAFAHALPVITTNWLAIPEIVDGTCGILIPPHDALAFVDAIRRLHEDRAYWLRLKDGARKRAARFEQAMWSRRFEELCEELVQD